MLSSYTYDHSSPYLSKTQRKSEKGIRHRLATRLQQSSHRRRTTVIAIIGVFLVLFLTSIMLLLDPTLPAQAADNILRPLIGEENTLKLESVYFAMGEQLKKAQYAVKPVDNSLQETDIPTLAADKVVNTDQMNLDVISALPGVKSVRGEGVWQVIPQNLFPNEAVIAKTFVRPDPERPYALVTIVQFDMKKLGIGTVAGTRYPGGSIGLKGPGQVPVDIQQSNRLLAAFNGGFQERDGHYGMVVNSVTYVPIRKGLGNLYMYKDGSFKLIDYTDGPVDPDAVAIRQNGPLLVKNGEITPFVEEGKDTWGRTTTNSMYTWRSALGVTKEGNLLYVVGGSLVPDTLAKALQMAGAVDAIQLDINPFWVRCFFYSPNGSGQYTILPLLKKMNVGGELYLRGYEKDFFYLYKK